MMKTNTRLVCFLSAFWLTFFAPLSPLYAVDHDQSFAYFGRGLSKILTAAFQIPRYMINNTLSQPIGVGTVNGVIAGSFYAVRSVLDGTLDIGRGVAPYAKYAGLFFL